MKKLIYTYKVKTAITDYGFNKKVGDLMTTSELQSIPPYYKKCVTLLESPIPNLTPEDIVKFKAECSPDINDTYYTVLSVSNGNALIEDDFGSFNVSIENLVLVF